MTRFFWRLLYVFVCTATLSGLGSGASAQNLPLSKGDSYNYVIGTQTFDPAYKFTQEDGLVETAREILKMGSNTIKFKLPHDKIGDAPPANLTEVVRSNPSVKTVLDLPFAHILLWAYPVHSPSGEVVNPQNLDANYHEIYDLTRYLLTAYRGTHKTFYVGHWEGDWYLLRSNPDYTPSPDDVKNILAWINIRQKAVDDAKRDTPHQGVEVFNYLEVNRVQDAIAGKTRLTNAVLPYTKVDYVSYSSYDSLENIEKQLPAALDYIASKLPAKKGIPGKRVWIGEYGFPAISNSPAQQNEKSRRVMRVALNWGCPFALYWEFYNNEIPNGVQNGFWLVNDKNEKQPVYFTHQKFLAQARDYVSTFQKSKGRLPTRDEFNRQAQLWLKSPLDP